MEDGGTDVVREPAHAVTSSEQGQIGLREERIVLDIGGTRPHYFIWFDMSRNPLKVRIKLALSFVLTPFTLILLGRSIAVRTKHD